MSSQDGVTVGEAADQLGISAPQLSQWRTQMLSAGDLHHVHTKLDALEARLEWLHRYVSGVRQSRLMGIVS